MCSYQCYCCGPSWASVVNGIAVFDLLMSAIPITFETASLGMLAGVLVPWGGANQSGIINCTDTDSCTWLYEYLGDGIHFDFDTWTVTALMLTIFFGFIVEGYLFSTLRRGVNDKIHKECRRWYYCRLFLLLLVTAGSITKILTNQYSIYFDGFLDILKFYRFITLIIVRCYMVELAHTVGIIYIKPPKRPKRGSL